MYSINPLSAFKDNYIWTLQSLEGSRIIVVDPGDANPVLSYLQSNNLDLEAILLTHHHWDHSGGIVTLKQYFPNIPIYGSKIDQVEGVNQFVKEGQTFTIKGFDSPIQVLDIPGHTLGHVAYFTENNLFCGDTLFSCGCGRLFEGTPAQMVSSLKKIKQLPKETLIYCGHEYTLANIAFAENVEPNNIMLKKRRQEATLSRNAHHPTLPVSLASELQTNPFLRCDAAEVINSVEKTCGKKLNNEIAIFTELRQWKNLF